MYGAHIRYNCQIQEKRGTRQLQKEFEAIWDEWKADLTSFPWDRWDTAFLWQLANLHTRQVKDYTIEFVEAWIDGIHGAATTEKLDALVTRQERLNKKARARLHPTADISESNWVGIGDLNYRLNVARTIISDERQAQPSSPRGAWTERRKFAVDSAKPSLLPTHRCLHRHHRILENAHFFRLAHGASNVVVVGFI